jgi:hypothetical protein
MTIATASLFWLAVAIVIPFAWLSASHHLSKDDEVLTAFSETFVRIALIRIMLCQLGRAPNYFFKHALTEVALPIMHSPGRKTLYPSYSPITRLDSFGTI